MEELDINRVKLLLLAFLVITVSSCVGTAAEIYVQPGGPNPIQAAVNNASSGDTIIVAPGTYVGNIDISKTNSLNDLVLMSASGNPADTTIIADNSAPITVNGVISITKFKTNVTIKGFTISGASRTNTGGYPNLAGVYLENGKQCTIENNIFMNDGLGMSVSGGSGNIVSNNIVNRTKAAVPDAMIEGILIATSPNTMISQNMVSNNNYGIHVAGSLKGSSISGNSVNKNNNGIFLENTNGVTVDGNTLNSNDLFGIDLAGSSQNRVTNNNIVMFGPSGEKGQNTQGIQLIYSGSDTSPVGSDSNLVSNNTVSNADHGIFSNNNQNNTIQNNRVFDNNYGIAMRYTHNTRVINNNADLNRNVNNSEGIFLTWDDSGNTVSGNSASECDRGIELTDVCGANNLVDNNIVNANQYFGIYVLAPNNKISNNSLSQNARGIYLTGSNCSSNIVSSNTVTESSGNGITLLNTSSNNKIISNSLISNVGQKGIELFSSNNSLLDSNYALDNDMGIQVEYANGVTVNNNTAYQNRIGIRLFHSDNNNVTLNNATYGSGSDSGIDMNSATHNIISGNLITWNPIGITMCPACHDNQVFNNYFCNDVNTGIQNGQNTWFKVRTKGKNIVGGPYIGGNYWASPDGTGFSQTAQDTDGDGIANAPYTFTNHYNITITDSLPLVSVILPVADFSYSPTQGPAPLNVQFTDLSQNAESRIWNFGDGTNSNETSPSHNYSTAGTYNVNLTVSNKNDTVSKFATVTVQAYTAPPVTPVANFNANPTSGDAPLTVQFTDSSQNAAGWSWDFGDGTNSAEQSPSHTYSSAGTYNVNLVVSNPNGTSPKSTTITVSSSSGGSSSSDVTSSGSSSGGSGGGGAGGSPEPQNNVEAKELSQTFIASGQSAKFDFPQKATPVVSISFDSKKTVGKTTTIVEMLKAKSTLVSGVPADDVYKYVNIWVGNGGYATPQNIENAVVGFKVGKSWVLDQKIDKSTITLDRYSDKTWTQLPTSLSSEDDNYLYFTAQTPGFSPFAITGKITATVQPAVGKTQTENVNETTTETNIGNTTENNEQTQSPNTSTTGVKKSPGFDTVFGIVGLLAVFLYKRK